MTAAVVVLDTNILVSAIKSPLGPPAMVLLLVLRGDLTVCISPAVLAEYESVLHRPELKLKAEKVAETLASIRSIAGLVNPTETLKLSEHDDDNRFYECAAEGGADYIVTGNTRHFRKSYRNTRIITARELLELLAQERE
jgi:putative PIN family toxin of toxin-antitoxin system